MSIGFRCAAVLFVGLAASACLEVSGPESDQLGDCSQPEVDTSTWVRTTGTTTFLLPPGFEQTSSGVWERGSTEIRLELRSTDPPQGVGFEDLTLIGACRATIAAHPMVIEYLTRAGGATAEIVVVATWRSVPVTGGTATVIITARLRHEQADLPIVRRVIWSVQIQRGPGEV